MNNLKKLIYMLSVVQLLSLSAFAQEQSCRQKLILAEQVTEKYIEDNTYRQMLKENSVGLVQEAWNEGGVDTKVIAVFLGLITPLSTPFFSTVRYIEEIPEAKKNLKLYKSLNNVMSDEYNEVDINYLRKKLDLDNMSDSSVVTHVKELIDTNQLCPKRETLEQMSQEQSSEYLQQ